MLKIAYPDLEILRIRFWFQHSLFVLAGALCFGSALHGDFAFDDAVAIVRNADVTHPNSSLSDIWAHDFWGENLTSPTSHKSWRPLTTATFRWEHRVFGRQAAPVKLHNFMLHCAVCAVLLRLLRRLLSGDNELVAFGATLLFAVHPVHTEAVSGCVGRADVLCALWFGLALLVWSRRDEARQYGFVGPLLLHGALFTLASLALLSKELGVMVLPMCVALEAVPIWTSRRSSLWQRIRHRLVRWRTLSLIVMTCVLIYGRLWAMDFQRPAFKAMDNPVAAAERLQTRISSQLYLYALNVWLLLCPDWLSFDWALGSVRLVESFSDARCLAIVAVVAVFGALVWTRDRDVLTALALLIVPFVPASGIVPVGFVIAERVLYIPSIGLCALVAIGANRVRMRSPPPFSKLLLCSFGALVCVWALRCRWRAHEWTDESLLYRSALRVCPGNAKVHYNIAKLLSGQREQRPAAVRHYEEAIRLYPEYEVAYTNLGNLYREEHRLDLAEKNLRRALEIVEEFPPAWMNLGIVQAAQGRYDLALSSYRRALSYRPHYSTCLYNIGNLYLALRNESEALRHWTAAVQLRPQLLKAWANILAAHDNAGRTDEVLRLSEQAVSWAQLADDGEQTAGLLFIRANALGKRGDFAEAERLYHAVLAERPANALYWVNLGVLYHRWGGAENEERAALAYEQALARDASLRSAAENLAKLRRQIERRGAYPKRIVLDEEALRVP